MKKVNLAPKVTEKKGVVLGRGRVPKLPPAAAVPGKGNDPKNPPKNSKTS